ncbi:hypothetical protein [Amycolatopsis thermoflava]|uniref:hypothetical protein n=1 Tax=Amycolatopsis thermoflava TaxID=84480 RepID=UPI0012F8114D|nr:hypothetical protein [Amycolatopsis thermoflava]
MNDDFVWTPPGAGAAELESFLALRKGLPSHANESIHSWLVGKKGERDYIYWDFMLEFQQAARVDLGLQAVKLVSVQQAFQVFRKLNEAHRTWLVDFELSKIAASNPGHKSPSRVRDLEKILRDSGSSWTVKAIHGRYRLVEALPGAVYDVVDSALSSAGKASELLRSAWEFAFGVKASPSHAYYDAVRSVEVLSCPLVSPNDGNATLGKDINVLRNKPEDWQFVMRGSRGGSSVEKVLGMMQLLWHSQTDRHGRADYEDVTLEEAQAAVFLASTLVAWLSKGMLSRVAGSV